jgi:oligoribonuclease (3'-5' exoribonuclease)
MQLSFYRKYYPNAATLSLHYRFIIVKSIVEATVHGYQWQPVLHNYAECKAKLRG